MTKTAAAGSGKQPDLTFLSPFFWPEIRRGTERLIALHAQGLNSYAVRPRLLCGAPTYLPKFTREDHLDVWRLPRVGKRYCWRQGIDDHAAYLPLAAALVKARPEDVICGFYPTDILPFLGQKPTLSNPFVLNLMGPPDKAWASSHRGRLRSLFGAATRASQVTVLSRFAQKVLYDEFQIESAIENPPVDLGHFAPGTADRFSDPTLLFASDPLNGAKNLDLLVEAFVKARKEPGLAAMQLLVNFPSTTSAQPNGKRLSESLQQVEGIQLVDLDDPSDLLNAYRQSWLTVLPSFNEAFGLVVAESLACGTPALSFAGEGPAELITDGYNGVVAEARTVEALRDSIIRGLQLVEVADLQKSCAESVQHLHPDAYAHRMLKHYRQAATQDRLISNIWQGIPNGPGLNTKRR